VNPCCCLQVDDKRAWEGYHFYLVDIFLYFTSKHVININTVQQQTLDTNLQIVMLQTILYTRIFFVDLTFHGFNILTHFKDTDSDFTVSNVYR